MWHLGNEVGPFYCSSSVLVSAHVHTTCCLLPSFLNCKFLPLFNLVLFSVNVELYKVLVKELAQILERQFAGNVESRAAGMVINTMGWIEGVGYEVFESDKFLSPHMVLRKVFCSVTLSFIFLIFFSPFGSCCCMQLIHLMPQLFWFWVRYPVVLA